MIKVSGNQSSAANVKQFSIEISSVYNANMSHTPVPTLYQLSKYIWPHFTTKLNHADYAAVVHKLSLSTVVLNSIGIVKK